MFSDTSDLSSDVLGAETRHFGWLLHLAGAVLTTLCGVIGYAWIYAPSEGSIADLAGNIKELRLSVANAPIVRREHSALVHRLEDLRDRMSTLQRRVPHDADAGKFLREVSTIARDEDLAISNFLPEKPTDREGFTELEITLTGQGSYKSICTFLARVNQLSRLSKVNDLKVSAPQVGDNLPMSATLIIYFGLHSSDVTTSGGVRSG